jgi:anti-anti-sigma factor
MRDQEEEVGVRTVGEVTFVDVRGNITARSEPFLVAAFERIGPAGRVVLRFEDNSSINGAGIAVLIQLLTDSERHGTAVALAGLSENFRKVFALVGIPRLRPSSTPRTRPWPPWPPVSPGTGPAPGAGFLQKAARTFPSGKGRALVPGAREGRLSRVTSRRASPWRP